MSYLKQYVAYLKDNPEHYWFKRKLYGWGWTPATAEGWATLVLFVGVFVWIFRDFMSDVAIAEPTFDDISVFLVKVGMWVTALLLLCWSTGESPKWQWGVPEK